MKEEQSNMTKTFWDDIYQEIENESKDYFKPELPLARIKKLMRVEEEVKNIASEVPILFSKVTQHFIEEITIKSLTHSALRKKRIIQKKDLYDVFKDNPIYDFLFYLMPAKKDAL